MAHFAEVKNGIVTQVIVAEQDFIDGLPNPTDWVQTSYNTKGGIHLLGVTPLRKNYAGIGFRYDKELDAFIPPQPYPSWIIDKNSGLWKSPTPKPEDEKFYSWNEENKKWQEREKNWLDEAEQEWTYTGYYLKDGELVKDEAIS